MKLVNYHKPRRQPRYKDFRATELDEGSHQLVVQPQHLVFAVKSFFGKTLTVTIADVQLSAKVVMEEVSAISVGKETCEDPEAVCIESEGSWADTDARLRMRAFRRLWRPVENVKYGALQASMRNLVVTEDCFLVWVCLKNFHNETLESLIAQRIAIGRNKPVGDRLSLDLCDCFMVSKVLGKPWLGWAALHFLFFDVAMATRLRVGLSPRVAVDERRVRCGVRLLAARCSKRTLRL